MCIFAYLYLFENLKFETNSFYNNNLLKIA